MYPKTNWPFCRIWGRRHWRVCHSKCKEALKNCHDLKIYEEGQARHHFSEKMDKLRPAFQRYLPEWIRQEWFEEKIVKEKKKEEKEEVR